MVVLIVDDEKVVAESMAAVFRLSGHEAHYATNPRAALSLAKEKEPHLLIADVVMPEETGIELAIKLLRELPKCKILLMSGQAETTNLLEDAEQQGHHFEILAKPVSPRDLLHRAQRLVDEADGNSEAATAASS
jgi:DNA-binding NtrC family response regulator